MGEIKRGTIIDLTKPLDTSFIPFSTGTYSDPSLEMCNWSSIRQEGFRVSKLSFGTQTGTHIDAPAHFLEDGATLDVLSPDHLIGNYFLVDLPRLPSPSDVAQILTVYDHQKIIFLRTPEGKTTELSLEAVKRILSLSPLMIVLSGEIEMEESESFEFNRLVAHAGKFLVEDLDRKAAMKLNGSGEIFVAPLRLTGVSGSPCRVIARTDK